MIKEHGSSSGYAKASKVQTPWRNMPVRFKAKSFLWKFFCVIATISYFIFH